MTTFISGPQTLAPAALIPATWQSQHGGIEEASSDRENKQIGRLSLIVTQREKFRISTRIVYTTPRDDSKTTRLTNFHCCRCVWPIHNQDMPRRRSLEGFSPSTVVQECPRVGSWTDGRLTVIAPHLFEARWTKHEHWGRALRIRTSICKRGVEMCTLLRRCICAHLPQ